MKRVPIFLALLCAFVLTACGLSPGRAEYEMSQDAAASTFQNEAGEFTEGQNELRETEIQELVNDVIVLHNSMYNEWERESEDCILHSDCVPDAESALLFGDALLKQFQRDGSFHNYAPHQISYQADPEIWIISCWEDLGPYSTSASVSFAIRADDAQVVSIYLGEADEFTEGQNELRESEKQELLNNVKVLHESCYNVWERENEDCILHLDCVPDAESALLFGDALLRQFQRDGSFPRYAPHQISYQADPEIWIISCWEDLGPYSTSASVSFAIRADDAQVVSIYLSE